MRLHSSSTTPLPISRDEAIASIEHKDDAEFDGGQYFKAFKVKTAGTNISDLMYQHRDKRFDAYYRSRRFYLPGREYHHLHSW